MHFRDTSEESTSYDLKAIDTRAEIKYLQTTTYIMI